MKLGTKARYGVRALFDIAYHASGRPTQARDVARRQGIPLRYLEQIFQELRRAHLIEARRGPRGGYLLARAPEAISIGDVVRAVQGPIELFLASEAEAPSSTALPNPIPATIWQELSVKIRACFDGVNLRDLCRRSEALGIHRGEEQPHMYFI